MNLAENEIYDLYWNNEQKSRKYTIRIYLYIVYHLQVFLSPCLYSFYCIFVGKIDPSAWPLPFNMSVPFDITIMWGWYLMWFIQINAAFSYCLATVLTTSYFMICCFYINAMCDHFDFLIRSIEFDVRQNLKETNFLKSQQISQKITDKLINAVKHHSNVLE